MTPRITLFVLTLLTITVSLGRAGGTISITGPYIGCTEDGNTYTRVTEVYFLSATLTSQVVRDSWEPSTPPTSVTVACAASLTGFGEYTAGLGSATVDGYTASTPAPPFSKLGDCGAPGGIKTSRKAYGVIIGAAVTNYSVSQNYGSKEWSGTGGFVKIKQMTWNPSGNIGLPWGISIGGEWTTDAEETFDAAAQSGSWTLTWDEKVLCYRDVDAGQTQCGAEVSDSYDHYITCSYDSNWNASGCGRNYWSCSAKEAAEHKIINCWRTWCPNGSYHKKCQGHSGSGSGSGNPPIGNNPQPPTGTSNITYACGIHSGPESGSSGHVAASCGLSSHYICDGSDHSLIASCSETQNGDSCTVTSFYACTSHTHEYPPEVCARQWLTGCNGDDHQYDCPNCDGFPYSCNGSAVASHSELRDCTRPGCSATLTKCQNKGQGDVSATAGNTCITPYRKGEKYDGLPSFLSLACGVFS